MKKIALISDVHGNYTALKYTIADAKKQGTSEFWFLGDLLMPGPGTNTIFDLLNSVNTTYKIRGNWDDFLFEDILAISKQYINEPQTTYIVELLKYVFNHLKPQYLNQMNHWPIAATTSISDLNILMTHNTPTKNYGHELLPYEQQSNFDNLLFKEHPQTDIAIYGHTHHQLLRTSSNGQLIINPGSIGQPYTPWKKFSADRRAQYAILTFDDTGYGGIDFRKVTYPIKDELNLATTAKLPFIELYEKIFTDGKAFTHNDAELNDQIQKYNYKSDVLKYLQKLSRFE
ncbi:metallophosphoesterase [Companilactobacillus crustorum]|uniref:Phosphoesterase-related protein n=3 Tax=Companilactobacillus TaxID=2767879 RepID=A0A837RKN6_9LACO|nr:metallophosphoesterase family protein [Companilactobacillus crustorum]APU71400.1 hypothetical protein BI355_1081 [Companilactobacillus crustorum]KRK43809.1 phosphoesterase-related protein [Companilactobacillus crustorum JCM 15951]KRO21134.1 phosphoesterase-related protein [Companilactobacillus crustorum]GEO76717.1 metallophosphoesterase [Companilactobacillus crustorum]